MLDEEGKQLGIFSKEEALKKAHHLGVDVVEIAPNADPPVCKLIDFKKFIYQEKKRQREQRKKAKTADLKTIKMRPFISEHDFQIRAKKARQFLTEGSRVRIMVQFFGRQITHKDFGYKIFDRLDEELRDIGVREGKPQFQGKKLIAFYKQKK